MAKEATSSAPINQRNQPECQSQMWIQEFAISPELISLVLFNVECASRCG